MRFTIQRVTHASVKVDGQIVGQIGKGFLVLVGISDEDSEAVADKMVAKMVRLRIFDDENGKTNLDLAAVNGSLLIVSQFTLYADVHHGNRPSFIRAGAPDKANELYEYIIRKCRGNIPVVEHGVFGAVMQVELCNDGPFTILMDSGELGYDQ